MADVTLTNLAYMRWLRAHRPPLDWFLKRSEDDQEALALIGDQYVEQLSINAQDIADEAQAQVASSTEQASAAIQQVLERIGARPTTEWNPPRKTGPLSRDELLTKGLTEPIPGHLPASKEEDIRVRAAHPEGSTLFGQRIKKE